MLYKSVTELIGNTPLIEISKEITKLKNINVYAKCELYNPFGSLKDRAGYAMLKDEIQKLKENNMTVIESSSGNTAKALQIICSMNGIPFKTVTNRIKIPETKEILKVAGAEIEELPGLSECPDPTDPNDPVAYIERIVSENHNKYYHTNQYTNLKNPKVHYEHTGKEIYEDLGKVDYFFGTLGTTGSSRGTIEYLLEKNKNLKKIGIIAEKGDTIPGIRNKDEMYEVGIFNKSLYDEIVLVNSDEAIEEMLVLNRKCGILGGPTSGAAFKGTLKYLREIDDKLKEPANAVFIACDRMEWYMSYIKKRRPEIFDSEIKRETIRTLTEEDMKYAKTIDINNAEEWIEKNNPTIIDLRGNLAYKNGHIANAINITDIFFEDLVDNGTPFSKENSVLLVCSIGDKSKKFSSLLNKKGMNAYGLENGMTAWRENSLPVKRSLREGII
ncbi:MAG: pyridoxal-phosphate dependent enzyme [Clostridiales bacterium]|nr:pyridoxal-phosphate dependent enzyme [Clostridiales bacterium]